MTGRHYTIDGTRYPSVTTILTALANDGITAWKLRVGLAEAERISKDATDYGTDLHALVEIVNRDNRRALGPGAREIVRPYLDWFDEHVERVLGVEKLLVSRRHGFAGTTDAVVVLRGDTHATIVDLKSSKTDLGQHEWALQTAAYALAAEEEGIDAQRRIIVRMPRAEPGRLYLHEFDPEDLAVDQRAFLAVLRVFTWRQAQKTVHQVSPNSLGRMTLRRRHDAR
jgi:hypothetical protein